MSDKVEDARIVAMKADRVMLGKRLDALIAAVSEEQRRGHVARCHCYALKTDTPHRDPRCLPGKGKQ